MGSQILDYHGGIFNKPNAEKNIDHIISVIGWGNSGDLQYWIVRNSWGAFWGEMGYIRVAMGGNQLGLEEACSWATVQSYTEVNVPCNEDGSNCQKNVIVQDPGAAYVYPAEIRLL